MEILHHLQDKASVEKLEEDGHLWSECGTGVAAEGKGCRAPNGALDGSRLLCLNGKAAGVGECA